MELMQRWQLKQSAKEQLRGKWGNMALKSFLLMLLPSAILWAVFAIIGACFAVGIVMPKAHFDLGLFDLHGIGLNGFAAVGTVFNALLYLCAILVAVVLDFGFSDACIKLRSGEVTGVGTLFGKFHMLPRILMYCLLLVIIGLPYIVTELLGAVLSSAILKVIFEVISFALMLAYIYIALRLSMAMYILLENPYTTAQTALKQSWYIMKGQCFRFFVLNLSFLGWGILAALSCGIGMFWLQPYVRMTTVNFYYNLKEVCLNRQAS